jgi:mono/diheme cytochrome c family protein
MSATLVALCVGWSVASAATSGSREGPEARQIERGRYLVKTTGCNDCHTPGYIENAGRVEESRWLIGNSLGWQGPWGTTYPANLRLLTQSISADQWLLAARRQMRPPMPWFALRAMTDADLLAIYYFTRSLGPAGTPAPAFIPPGQVAQTPIVKIPG